MEIKLAVLADFASITLEGKLNILGIFDEINSAQLPAAVPIFYIVVSYEAGPAEFETEKVTQVVLSDADGKTMARLEQKLKVPRPTRPGSRSTVNQIGAIMGLSFPKAGDYQFAFLINDQEAKSICLRVNQVMGG